MSAGFSFIDAESSAKMVIRRRKSSVLRTSTLTPSELLSICFFEMGNGEERAHTTNNYAMAKLFIVGIRFRSAPCLFSARKARKEVDGVKSCSLFSYRALCCFLFCG